ncbi:MAG: DNA sulfur modification protein DndD [Kiritimatiellae bacterium]|nr:DNA sulfur modification protein DndD [Kiritimatiellia bacterium]MDD5519516.1 DNA sulfur modification protein DndD [Kiritimatiellia bacterium]
MIIDRIIVENFGVYAGRNVAVLTPPDSTRVITLFGGDNGAGKTTLLKALYLAFYGKRASLADRAGKNYEDFLEDCIHSESNPHTGARVEVHFRKQEEGKEHSFRITRHWWMAPNGIEERLEVYQDQPNSSESLSDTWPDFIEDYLPTRIANLFFFDGEQIKQLAAPASATDLLRTAVHSLLGLEIVERLSADLLVLERRKRQATKNDQERQKLIQLEQEVSRIEELHNVAVLDAGQAQTRVDRARKELAAIEDTYVTQGGTLHDQRGTLNEHRVRIESELSDAEAELREMAAGILPFALVGSLLPKLEKQMSQELEADHLQIQAAILQTRDNALLGYLKRSRAMERKVLQAICAWLDKDRKERIPSPDHKSFLDASQQALNETRTLITTLPDLQHHAVELITKVRTLQQELDNTERKLAQVPDDDAIAHLHKELTSCKEKVKVAETKLAVAISKSDQLFRELTAKRTSYAREIETNADADDAMDSDRRIIEYSTKVRTTLAAFRTAAISRRVGQLERLICESFCQLIRKKDFVSSIRIDPETFDVHLMDPKGREMPALRLSAGESQVLATAMLWGLGRASGRVVPTIIDTPLGRLDSSHRRHLVERYFPNAGHQVILLSTDEEITKCHLDQLKPFLGNTYRLQHDSSTRSTKIEEGYFYS